MSLLGELKRRNVFRVATFYVVAAWILLQADSLLFVALGVPAWGLKLLLGLLLLGFPFAIVFAWVFELTPEGLKREHEVQPDASITGRTAAKLNVLIVVLLLVAIGIGAMNWWHERATGLPQVAAPTTSRPGFASNAAGPAAGTNRSETSAPSTEPASASISIAVLPFLNMSDDKANEYFSDGLTEELLNVLANVQGLRVIARTSSFAYKGKDVKIADVARDLSVDHVLEGSVRKSGNKVRITTQLIRASDSSHLWSETYDRDLKDIFAVQDEISQHVVEALKVKLLPQDSDGTAEVGNTANPAAYEAFLMGRHLFLAGEAENTLRGALRSLDEAIRLDPQYAQAYAEKSAVLGRLASNGYEPFDKGFGAAKQAAQRALEIAPDLAEGYLTLGLAETILSGSADAAVAAMNRALELNPGSAQVQEAYSQFASAHGDDQAAIRAAKTAVALDPLSPRAYANLAGVYINARRYAEAEGAARRALSLAPRRPGTPQQLGYALLLQGRFDEALEAFNDEPVEWSRRNGRCLVLAKSGKQVDARRELAEFESKFGDAASYQYAGIEAQLGDKDAAMRWLLNARRVHDPGLVTGVLRDPVLDPLRGDPRFEKLLLELGFVEKS